MLLTAPPTERAGLPISGFSLKHGIPEHALRKGLRLGLYSLPRVGRVHVWPADPTAAGKILDALRRHGLAESPAAAATA